MWVYILSNDSAPTGVSVDPSSPHAPEHASPGPELWMGTSCTWLTEKQERETGNNHRGQRVRDCVIRPSTIQAGEGCFAPYPYQHTTNQCEWRLLVTWLMNWAEQFQKWAYFFFTYWHPLSCFILYNVLTKFSFLFSGEPWKLMFNQWEIEKAKNLHQFIP